ncbi:MAG: hypothetical protein WAL85_08230 [Candidatus Korobacteraceae bacterium]
MELAGKARGVALSILAYLVEHPDAKDSLEGIGVWWIEDSAKCSQPELRGAVEALVELGALRVWNASPGSIVYGPSENFLQSPARFLSKLGPVGTDEN